MELGSEFNLVMSDLRISQNSFFEYMGNMNYYLFDSGRSALKAIIGTLGNGNILMPEYICESVLKCFPADKMVFYKLKDNLQIDADDLLNKISSSTAVVYLMHYFGALQSEELLSLLREEKEKYGFTIIEDTTHGIFSVKQTIGDYCVASLRKWFAVPNGGVLYTSDFSKLFSYEDVHKSTDNDKAYAMMLKTMYLKGKLDCNSQYRKIFAECEDRFDEQSEILRISDYSEFLLGCFDVDEIVKKRKYNLNNLKNKLSSIGAKQICDFAEKDCPFALPVLVPDRYELHKYLMENEIYCAIHWPFDGMAKSERPLAFSLSKSMISLPIDQRYGEEEMEYLFQVLKAYKGRLRF